MLIWLESLFGSRVCLWYCFLHLLLPFIVTFVVEIIIIIVFLGSNNPVENYKKFYKSVFSINLFTFPLTQVIAFILFQFNIFSRALTYIDNYIIIYSLNYILVSFILIEPVPIFLECLLYLKIFKKFNKTNYFQNRVEKKTIILFTITANLVTYLIGIGIFLNYL